ncbi:MAG: DNA methylase [Sporichthyaceae bacterium]
MATALVTANSLGLEGVGYDPHPFFHDIATAKVSTRSAKDLELVAKLLANVSSVADSSEIWSVDARKFLDKLINQESLAWLAGALMAEVDCPIRLRPLYRLIVTRLLEGAAGSKTDGIYKAPTTTKRSVDISEMTDRVLSQIRDDLRGMPSATAPSQLYRQSSECMHQLAPESVDICVTSPPYLNNFDFAEMTRMELYFWRYASSWREITDTVRGKLVINTTTAPTIERRRQSHWESHVPNDLAADLYEVRDALTFQRKQRAGKKEYDSLVFPYFAQMGAVIRETESKLKPGANFHMVVSDAALYGVHIHTEKYLARLMSYSGFEVKEIIRLRDRGGRWVLDKRQGSSEGLGEFHIHAIKGT